VGRHGRPTSAFSASRFEDDRVLGHQLPAGCIVVNGMQAGSTVLRGGAIWPRSSSNVSSSESS
jgi:hypothetical protein